MHHIAPFALMSVAMASRSVVLEAPDDACGYLNGIQKASFGCLQTSETCAVYYPTSTAAAAATAGATFIPIITPAPQPSIVCCEPSRGDCIVQPTKCVDTMGDCTGVCANDPMTLKCTTEPHRYCNRAHFESPLYFLPMEDLGTGLRPTDAPIDGWVCGPSAIPVQHTNASHSKTTTPTAHASQSSASPTTTLGVTVTLSEPVLGPSSSVSPSTTLSVTITLSKPGLALGSSPWPSPPTAAISEDIDSKDDTTGSEACCLDEQDTSEPCYYDTRRARLQRRQAMNSSMTAAWLASTQGDEIMRGSAVVSTTWLGQTDRAPFVEATRVWNIVTPTVSATSTTKTNGPRRWPSSRKRDRLTPRERTAIVLTIGLVCALGIVYGLAKKFWPRPDSGQQQDSEQHQSGHGPAEPPVHVANRQESYVKFIWDHAMDFLMDLAPAVGQVADLSQPGIPIDHGNILDGSWFQRLLDQVSGRQPDQAVGGQPDQAVGGQRGPVFHRVPPPSTELAFQALPDQIVGGQPDQAVGGRPDQAVEGQPDQAVGGQRGSVFHRVPPPSTQVLFQALSDQIVGGQPDQAVGGQSDQAARWQRRPIFHGKPHPAFSRNPGPACGRDQCVSPKSGEIADDEKDLELQFEGSPKWESKRSTRSFTF